MIGGAEMYCGGCGQQLDEDSRFCKYCGTARDGGPTGRAKLPQEIAVKNYRTQKEYQKDAQRMSRAGWRVQSQSGQVDTRPGMTRPLIGWGQPHVTVTWVRDRPQ
jgi:hypothetical protein